MFPVGPERQVVLTDGAGLTGAIEGQDVIAALDAGLGAEEVHLLGAAVEPIVHYHRVAGVAEQPQRLEPELLVVGERPGRASGERVDDLAEVPETGSLRENVLGASPPRMSIPRRDSKEALTSVDQSGQHDNALGAIDVRLVADLLQSLLESSDVGG